MASFNGINTGSAVSDVVQQILQRRRDEQRQMMMDRLNVAKFKEDVDQSQADLKLRQEAAVRQKELSDAQIAASNEQRVGNILNTLPEGEAELSTFSPEIQKLLMERGRIRRETITPRVESSTNIQAPANATPEQLEAFDKQMESNPPEMVTAGQPVTRDYYTGSPKFQEETAKRKRIEDFFASDASKNLNPNQRDLFKAAAIADINIPANMIPNTTRVLSPTGRLINQYTGYAGDETIHMPWAPQPSSANVPQIYQNPDGKGGYTSHWLRPGEQPNDTNRIRSLGPIDKGDLPVNQNRDVIPFQALDALRKSFSIKDSRLRPASIAQAQATITNIAQQRGITPDVIEAVYGIMEDMQAFADAGKPFPPVDQVLSGQKHYTPEEAAQIKMILQTLVAGGQ